MNSILLKIDNVEVCKIVKRLNKFVVIVEINGRKKYGYLANTGKLSDYIVCGRKAFCVPKESGRTQYRIIAVEEHGLGAVLDTFIQMKAFEKAIDLNLIPWLKGYRIAKRNPRLDHSVIDYLLEKNNSRIYIEVKSAVQRVNTYGASYPDCPTPRGRRHIKELIHYHITKGLYTGIVFIAAIPCVKYFTPNKNTDPEIHRLIREAINHNVLVKAVNIYFVPEYNTIVLGNTDIPVVL